MAVDSGQELTLDEWRAWVYLLLAQLFRRAPQPALLRSLADERLLSTLLGGVGDDELSRDCIAVEQEISRAELQPCANLLQEDYARLFVGPDHLPAPPWESVYRSQERLLFGEQTLAVREFYRAYGLESKHRNEEPEDHIALELEFMAYLCRAGGAGDEAAERCREGQGLFLREHLAAWAPDFCADVARNAASGFYRGLAAITARWLALDSELLASARQEGI